MRFEKLVEKFGARKSGKEWIASCPAHEDHIPSLAIRQGDKGIVLFCHAGCTTEQVLSAAGLNFADLYPEETKLLLVKTYDYTDEHGKLLFQACRYLPKDFRFRRPDGKDGWIWKLDDARRVLYNLPEVVHPENKTIAICEGEKDCITAHERFGLCATTNPMGAGNWRDEYSQFLGGKNVVIFPDNDKAGLEHAEQVARSLYGKAASVKICMLPPKTKDLSDWNAPPDEAARYIGSFSKPWSSDGTNESFFATFEQFESDPPLTYTIETVLQDYTNTAIGGLSGHSKTLLMLSISKAGLLGPPAKLWGLFPVVRKVERIVYLIPESTRAAFKHRLKLFGLYEYVKSGRLLVRTLNEGPTPKLDDEHILAVSKDALIVLDTAVRFAEGDEQSATDNSRGLAEAIFALFRAGARNVLWAHHSPKSFEKEVRMTLEGILRGTGDLGAMAGTCWGVKQIDRVLNVVHIENVKPRDLEPCGPFQLIGRPYIDQSGDFALLKPPGECGSLAEEAPNPTNEDRKQTKDDRVAIARKLFDDDPNMPVPEMIAKFREIGLGNVSPRSMKRYRAEARRESDRSQ